MSLIKLIDVGTLNVIIRYDLTCQPKSIDNMISKELHHIVCFNFPRENCFSPF